MEITLRRDVARPGTVKSSVRKVPNATVPTAPRTIPRHCARLMVCGRERAADVDVGVMRQRAISTSAKTARCAGLAGVEVERRRRRRVDRLAHALDDVCCGLRREHGQRGDLLGHGRTQPARPTADSASVRARRIGASASPTPICPSRSSPPHRWACH